MSKSITIVTAALVAASGLFAHNALAETVININYGNATSSCQSSLPVFDTNVRKSPVGVSNIGSNSTFITCSYISDTSLDELNFSYYELQIIASNTKAVDQDLTCTMVSGGQGYASYFSKTETIPANDGSYLDWFFIDDNDSVPFDGPANANCLVSSGLVLNDHYVLFDSDVGTGPAP